MNINFRDALNPLGRKSTHSIDEDLPLRCRAYFPFIFAILTLIILSILKGFRGRWFTGVGLILSSIGSFLLFFYTDEFIKSCSGGTAHNDFESEGIRRRFIAKDSQ
jgi:hypothetical protein